MKKFLTAILAALMLSGSFTGCVGPGAQNNADGGSGKSSQEEGSAQDNGGKIELEFFNQKKEGEGVYNNEIIKRFQEENPNIIIKQVAPADAETVFFTRVSTNDIPDIMSIYPAETAYQAVMDEGIVADLTGEPFLQNASEAALEYSKYNGKLYAMPFALSSFGIFCNKDMYDAAGLSYPTTWDELIEVCKKFQESGVAEPMLFADKDAGTLSQEGERMIGIIKNDIFKDCDKVGHGEGSFKDPDKDWFRVQAEAMLQMREYGPKDSLALGREQATADFVNEKHAMYVAGTYSFAGILDARPDMNVEMIPLPNPYPGGEQTLPINVDIALGYSASSKYPEECKKFLEFVSRPEIYQFMADKEGTPPVIKGVNYQIKPLMKIKDEIENGKTFLTVINFWPAGFRSEWSIYLQNLLTDRDIDSFLSETDRICVDYYTKDE